MINRIIEMYSVPNDLFETYQNLLTENGIVNFDAVSEYTEYYEKFVKKYGTETATKMRKDDYLFAIDTFTKELRCWDVNNRRQNLIFSSCSSNINYIIILSFLAKFSVAQTNRLLQAAGLQELHGRNPIHCAYMYCLNNNISYDKCILKIIPEIETLLVDETPNNEPVINSKEALMAYVQKNKANPQDDAAYSNIDTQTNYMTRTIMNIDSKKKLKKYIKDNLDNFKLNRESPRKYFCQALDDMVPTKGELEADAQLAKLYDEKIDIRFNKSIRNIWNEFNEYYGNILSASVYEPYEDWYNQKLLNETLSATKFLKYINGEELIDRKTLILLTLYIYEYDISKVIIDHICIECGFNSVFIDKKTPFEELLVEYINQGGEVTPEFFEDRIDELFLLKTYCDLKYSKKKFERSPELENIVSIFIINMENIEEITDSTKQANVKIKDLCDILSCIHQIKKSDEITAEMESCIAECLTHITDKVAMYTGHDIESIIQDFDNAFLKHTKSQMKNYRKKLFPKYRENKDSSKYVENPFYIL